MIQAIVKKGKVFGEEVPAPLVSKGALLIKVVNSCISAGTEISSVRGSGNSLIRRALDQPQNLLKAIDMARSDGIAKVYAKVTGKLDAGSPTGYSISGVVIAVGEGATRFQVGDHVAAAGAGLANHAEYVDVPENLVMKMPMGMDFKAASTVTLGGIAMQGVRRADLRLGEMAVVFGAGILGLLTIQMLKHSGARVAALDLEEARLAIAADLGAELTLNPASETAVTAIQNWTGGYGADAVIFTAATSSSTPLSDSFQMCKRKGRVVMVGVVGRDVKREDIYQKELDFLISTSYGPGRYDKSYEEKGLDYPYAYVRWTENRNMTEYLRLVQCGAIRLEKLIDCVYPIGQVTEAFDSLQRPGSKPLMVLLDYGVPEAWQSPNPPGHLSKISIAGTQALREVINVALVGAGGFATGMHLPNMEKLSQKFRLHCVVNRTGHKAKAVAHMYKASYATCDYQDVLHDPEVDLVLIATRHDSHATLALQALQAGKHVFVEKPLATTQRDLDMIKAFYAEGLAVKPLLFVGFNRRFSTYAREIKRYTDKRINPLLIHYRMNAGFVPLDHWVHENGGRFVGEGCHIVDLMTYLTGSRIKTVSVDSLVPANDRLSATDNKVVTIAYQDGSVATIQYFAVGSKDVPKEFMEVHFDGKSVVLDDYKSLKGFGLKVNEITTATSQKGQLEELEELHLAIRSGSAWPIELWDMVQTTEVTFAVNSH